ncbi:hypothetical protein M9458_035542, partial [Cirrhinus mrigala]
MLRSRKALFEEGAFTSVPQGAGPASTEAERVLHSWGSQMDLLEGMETGDPLSPPLPGRSVACSEGSEARSAATSSQGTGSSVICRPLRTSSYREVQKLSVATRAPPSPDRDQRHSRPGSFKARPDLRVVLHGPDASSEPLRAAPTGEEQVTSHYTVLLPLPALQGTAASGERLSRISPPEDVAEPGRSTVSSAVSCRSAVTVNIRGQPRAAVLRTVEKGYSIQFGALLPPFGGVFPTLVGPEQALVMKQEVETLLRKEAIEVVPPHDRESGFYSRYFIVPKKDGGLRPIIDLRRLNRSVMRLKFKMLTVKQVVSQIRSEDWFVTIDLKDVYFRVSILPQHRKGEVYQYRVLPFGLALSPSTFTKCVDAARVPLRLRGIHHQGGLRSRPIYKLAHQILVWSQDKLLSLRAVHVPGQGPRPGEWMLHPEVWISLLRGRMLNFIQLPWGWMPLYRRGRGYHPSPPPGAVEAVGVASEGAQLIASSLSTEVVETILQKLYALKWKLFTSWCGERQQDPVNCPVGTVLEFLQARFSTGLSHSTLKVYVAAISAYHAPLGGLSVGKDPLVVRFLLGLLRLRPPVRPHVPTWDLAVVLEALCRPPFEPIEEISVWFLTIETALLLALTSLKRVGDLQALSVAPSYLEFAPGMTKAFLYPKAGYVPKVPTTTPQPVVLQAFCPPPFREPDQQKHNCMCPVCALDAYVHRAGLWRKSDQLFVCYGPPKKGHPATKQTLSRWIVDAISTAYESSDLPSPLGVKAHSTRAMAASRALMLGVPIQDICNAAGWSTPLTFVRFYNLD